MSLKVIVLGDSEAGKTTMCTAYQTGLFFPFPQTTIGVEYFSKLINIDSRQIRIKIWDTAGQESFRAITKCYYRDCDVAIFVFDLSKSSCIANIKKWYTDFDESSKKRENPLIVFIGNKNDLDRKAPGKEDIENEIRKMCSFFLYYEISSKNYPSSLNEIFYDIARNAMLLFPIETTEIKRVELVKRDSRCSMCSGSSVERWNAL